MLSPAVVLTAVLWRRYQLPQTVDADGALTKAADRLAKEVERQWAATADDHRLRTPAPIAVQWRWSERSVTGSVEDAIGIPNVRQRFPALPGKPVLTTDMMLSGDFSGLVDVYSGLGAGRLVILGGSGSGKTSAAILMLLESLKYRNGVDEVEKMNVPVPILFTPQGWDPEDQNLADWLTDQLRTHYPFLLDPNYGPGDAQ